MKARYDQFNPKRRFKLLRGDDLDILRVLASSVQYGGNPEHKMNPGDFGLTPPAQPRQGKSLCDDAGIYQLSDAIRLLQLGLCKGLISDRFSGKWPKNIWAVTANGTPLEAQLENPELGRYHGYPMPESDPLAADVLKRWSDESD
ncbi:hypothetical protein [Plasticicumulans sp.]|uniref:hypothetical protein n=1 Tax=Plasticicumulans sp. TaxID=2307179 RepID=UPI002C5E93D3|nr:hypothetical protein [Plasticicumulans sp.]MBS0357498.1 hypothetical protein [Pseudomonadota bacterium]HNK31438.1 hypothetical protein [Plasticicumulans sp.]HNM44508.1 hypothetical protein [Plasticicumulans sp.]